MNRCAWGDEAPRPRWSQGLEAARRGMKMGRGGWQGRGTTDQGWVAARPGGNRP